MNPKNLLCLLIALGVGSALPAQTEERQRTTINSDTLAMQGTEDHNYFHFGGNVHVVGQDLDIRCDELVVMAQREAEADETVGEIGVVEEIVATGNVVIVQAGREARAGRVEVDPVAGTIHFLEDPVIIQGDARAQAYGFVFYTEEKRLEAMNPPGFAAGQAEGRATISLSGLPVITPEVPEAAVTVGNGVDREASEEAVENAAEPPSEPAPGAEADASEAAGDPEAEDEAPAGEPRSDDEDEGEPIEEEAGS